jgi:hypothetical protein
MPIEGRKMQVCDSKSTEWLVARGEQRCPHLGGEHLDVVCPDLSARSHLFSNRAPACKRIEEDTSLALGDDLSHERREILFGAHVANIDGHFLT